MMSNAESADAVPLLRDREVLPDTDKPGSQSSMINLLHGLSDLAQIPKLVQYREDLHARTERPIFDLCILIVCYFGVGTTFYAVCDEDFTLMSRRTAASLRSVISTGVCPLHPPHPSHCSYAFFYATNVGLGVGYGNYHIRDIFTKWFTVFYIVAGSSLVVGSLSVFFNHIFYRIGRTTNAGADTVFKMACYMYVSMVVVGVIIGFKFEGYNSFVDALLFAVGNYTTAGLIEPHDSSSSLLWTTLSLFFGIPANFIVMGQIASRVLRNFYPEDTPILPGHPSMDSLVVSPRVGRIDPYVTYLETEFLRINPLTKDELESVKRRLQRTGA